jgi:hypothetical protein
MKRFAVVVAIAALGACSKTEQKPAAQSQMQQDTSHMMMSDTSHKMAGDTSHMTMGDTSKKAAPKKP